MKTKSIKNIFALALSRWLSGLTILFAIFTMVACGRYEEGPCISFRSPEGRLCGKKWHVVSFMKNDSDLTAQWTANYDWGLYFNSHYDSELGETSGIDVFEGNSEIAAGGWSFESDDPDGITANITKILFGFHMFGQESMIYGIYPLITKNIGEYKIIKLRHDELWLQHTDSVQNVYVIKFECN